MGCVNSKNKAQLRHALDGGESISMGSPAAQGERKPAVSIERCTDADAGEHASVDNPLTQGERKPAAAISIEQCIDSLGESCSIEQLKAALELEGGFPFDESRLKVAVHVFQRTESNSDGGNVATKLLCADLKRRGFAHFIGRTAPKGIFLGQCVSVGTEGVVGAITGTSKNGLCSVTVQTPRGVEVMNGVLAEDLAVCTNLDKTKQNTQTNYLQALAERVGPIPRSDTQWRAQVPLVMKQDLAERNKAQVDRDNKEMSAPAWAASFEAYCSHSANKSGIEQIGRAGGWSRDDAGVICFCLKYSKVLAASVNNSEDRYGALLHKYYGLMAQRAIVDAKKGPANHRFRSEATKVMPEAACIATCFEHTTLPTNKHALQSRKNSRS
jgi:hypothetical protein